MTIRNQLFALLLLTVAPYLNSNERTANHLACENLLATLDTLSSALSDIAKERSVESMAENIILGARKLQHEAIEWLAQNNVELAQQKLQQASRGVNTAIATLLSGETIIYQLKFSSPKEECEYEIRRTAGS